MSNCSEGVMKHRIQHFCDKICNLLQMGDVRALTSPAAISSYHCIFSTNRT